MEILVYPIWNHDHFFLLVRHVDNSRWECYNSRPREENVAFIESYMLWINDQLSQLGAGDLTMGHSIHGLSTTNELGTFLTPNFSTSSKNFYTFNLLKFAAMIAESLCWRMLITFYTRSLCDSRKRTCRTIVRRLSMIAMCVDRSSTSQRSKST